MKPMIFAAALMLSGTALAQTGTTTTDTTDDAVTQGTAGTTSGSTNGGASAGATSSGGSMQVDTSASTTMQADTTASTTMQTDTSTSMQTGGTMAGGMTVAPGNMNPERDARGIPVVSDAATAPAGWNEGPRPAGTGPSPSASAGTMGSAGALPPCSRTVTDRCTQTYERGRAR